MKNQEIEIKVKVNGENVPLSTISTETFEKIKAGEQLPDIEGIELVKDFRSVVNYIRENPSVYTNYYLTTKVDFIKRDDEIYLRVPLPIANEDWTFAAFDYVKDFCKAVETNSYPRHSGWMNPRYLYVKI